MYGMVNQAFKLMINEQYGNGAWLAISTAAGQSGEDYVAMQSLPDEVTYNLVGAACSHLKVEAPDLLFRFGHYWVKFALTTSYRELLLKSADNLFDMLRNLDRMHYQIGKTLTELRPPSFRVKEISPRKVQLLYFSERSGLQDFVRGLIHGLADLYERRVEVRFLRADPGRGTHLIFEVEEI